MKRTLVLAIATAATLLGTGAAQAARVDGSIGFRAGYPVYAPRLAYAPRPRFVEPAPIYVQPPAVYAPRPRLWLPPLPPLPLLPPLPFFGHGGWHHDDGRHGGWHDGHVSWRR